jgi:hypothetical protein
MKTLILALLLALGSISAAPQSATADDSHHCLTVDCSA